MQGRAHDAHRPSRRRSEARFGRSSVRETSLASDIRCGTASGRHSARDRISWPRNNVGSYSFNYLDSKGFWLQPRARTIGTVAFPAIFSEPRSIACGLLAVGWNPPRRLDGHHAVTRREIDRRGGCMR
jgi:hypothetical protein